MGLLSICSTSDPTHFSSIMPLPRETYLFQNKIGETIKNIKKISSGSQDLQFYGTST
jgi:hypothetical protein